MGPRLSIVSFKTTPKLYSDMPPLTSLSPLDLKNFLNLESEVRIRIVATAKEEKTLQYATLQVSQEGLQMHNNEQRKYKKINK